jgi:hypothetical protein
MSGAKIPVNMRKKVVIPHTKYHGMKATKKTPQTASVDR